VRKIILDLLESVRTICDSSRRLSYMSDIVGRSRGANPHQKSFPGVRAIATKLGMKQLLALVDSNPPETQRQRGIVGARATPICALA